MTKVLSMKPYKYKHMYIYITIMIKNKITCFHMYVAVIPHR